MTNAPRSEMPGLVMARRTALALLGGVAGCLTVPGKLLADAAASQPDRQFHLYLLIGQSNMAGRGPVDAESKVAHPRVLMLNKNRAWVPATDPLHFDKAAAGVGPGLAFGKRLRKDLAAPDVPFIASELSPLDPARAEAVAAFNAVVRGLDVRNYACVSGAGLGHKGDKLHYDTASARVVGQRYAGQMIALLANQQK